MRLPGGIHRTTAGGKERGSMHNFIFHQGTKIVFGGGCVKEYLASFVRGYGPDVL